METNDVALITGASSGIGAAFARKLAARGYDLVLVARREERLAALTETLARDYPISAETFVADLAKPADLAKIERRVVHLENLTLLVNNAGFGTTGKFTGIGLDRQLDMIHVHVIASVRLSRAALPAMVARGQGAIINVSSLAAFVPMPGNVTYCSTKAYLNSFSRALHLELAGNGVRVQALCPGFTYTEFHDTSEFEGYDRGRIPRPFWMTAEQVVADSLKALERGKVVCVPGWQNRLLVALINLTPISLQQWVLRQ